MSSVRIVELVGDQNTTRIGVTLGSSESILSVEFAKELLADLRHALESAGEELLPLPSFECRFEPHGPDTGTERDRIMRLGKEGWVFTQYVPHWGPHDGRTMLFIRRS